MTRTFHATRRPHFRAHDGRLVRLLAIIVVFAMGTALAVPTPAAAQVGSAVSGTVVDADGGALAGADVVLRMRVNGSLWSYHEATTDEAGGFGFSGLQPGTWLLDVRADGYRSNHTEVALAAGSDESVEVALVSLTERAYAGRLISGENESPIAGARITVTGYGDAEGKNERTTTSAADGTFRVRLFANENQILIEKSGFATYRDWVYQPSGLVQRDIWMQPVPPQTATITGTVVDTNGQPVQAYVDLYPVYDGDCCIAYADDAPASEPAPDRTMPAYYNNYNGTATDANGTFTMKAYPGKVTVQANRQGYLIASQQVTLSEGGTQTVTLTMGALPARTVTLSGVVTDADGNAIEGASVNVQVPAAGDHAWVSTDADGKYTLTVRPGHTIVEISRWGWCCVLYETAVASDGGGDAAESSAIRAPEPDPGDRVQYFPASRVLTTSDGEKTTLDVSLQKKPEPTATVVGYVLDQTSGEGIAGAHITLQNHATGDWGEATTDENGSYKFAAYGGYHTVRVWLDGYLPYSTNTVVSDSGSKRFDIEVVPGQAVNEGWWSPDGHKDGDGGHPEPRPMPASGDGQSEDAAFAGGAQTSRTGSESFSFERPSGEQRYTGSGGGLPAYDPEKSDETFGNGDNAESPVSAFMVIVIALGALAVVAGLRRER